MLGKLIEPELRALIAERRYKELREEMKDLDPVDIAEVLQVLTLEEGIIVFRILPRALAADVYENLPLQFQEDVLRLLSNEQIAALLNEMDPDDRTDLLEELPGKITTRVLSLLSPEERKIAKNLLGYPDYSVGRLMTPEYMAIREDWTVKQAFKHIRTYGRDKETINILYVVDEKGKLQDEIILRDLILATPKTQIADLMNRQVIALQATDDQETAAETMLRYDLSILPVVDSEGTLVGIVTNDDVMDVVVEEATEDIHRMGGMEALEEPYSQVSFTSMLKKRAGWLTLLCLGAMITINVTKIFHGFLQEGAVLALFIPLIMSSGGNSGSQATTLVIRALSLQDIRLGDWLRVFSRELLMGVLLGCILGGVALLRVVIWPESPEYNLLLAATVSISIIFVVMFGTIIGCLLPFILRLFGSDPALASAPLVTTLIDNLGIVIYFVMAYFILSGTIL
ncbi:magnesium transporter [bacterium]|nr:magnesium transporter [bacterium]